MDGPVENSNFLVYTLLKTRRIEDETKETMSTNLQCNAPYATNAHPKTRRRRLEFQSARLNTLENTMETLTLEMKEITTSLILNPKNSANVPFLLLQESNNARLRPNLQFDPSLVNTFGDSNRSSKMYVTTSGTSTLSRALAYGMGNKHYYTKHFHFILFSVREVITWWTQKIQ